VYLLTTAASFCGCHYSKWWLFKWIWLINTTWFYSNKLQHILIVYFMHWYLYVLFVVKLLVLYYFLQKRRNPEYEKKFALIDKLFMILLTILMIYLFHPYTKNPVYIDRETKLFLFIFGVMSLVHLI
jgi:hypothetical protein